VASNKNQHYVPRCYLKPFTQGGGGGAINLFNIDSDRHIKNAPVKSQCSGDYFYGKDLALEKALQATEGAYAACASRVQNLGYQLNEADRTQLRRFWLLQYVRTDAASRRVAEMSSGMVSRAGVSDPSFSLQIKEAVQIAMRVYVDEIRSIDDLKVCLMRNKTDVEFVTSDDPAILTNRWLLTSSMHRRRTFGLGTAGALFLLPIAPRICAVGYDGDVHSIEHKDGWVDIRAERDVDAINEHQLLNCRANIFLSPQQSFVRLRAQFHRVKERRLAHRHRINYAVLHKEGHGVAEYRTVERPAENMDDAIVHAESLFVQPSAWPSQLRFRTSTSVYTNGTGHGFVRRSGAELYGINGFRREKARL
jgi:hypothetical protein